MLRSFTYQESLQKFNLDKVLATVAYVAILLALVVIASTPPATGYELSIYDAYPWYLWGLLISVFILGISYTLYRVFFTSVSSGWFRVWLPMLLAYFILFLLPFFRGYPIYGRGDTMSHIGLIKDILVTGHVPAGNGYPIVHILVAVLRAITNVEPSIFVITLPAFFVLLYIFWAGKLGSAVFKNKALVSLVFIFAFFVTFSRVQQFAPYSLSLFVLPLFLYVFYKRQGSLPYTIVFVILILLLPFLHIFFSITLIIALLAFLVSDRLWEKLPGVGAKLKFLDFSPSSTVSKENYGIVMLLMSVYAGSWAIERYMGSIATIASWILFSAGGKTYLAETTNILARAGLSIYQFIYLFWTRLSNQLFFYVSPVVFFAVTVFVAIRKRVVLDMDRNILRFLAIYLIFVLISIVSMFTKGVFGWGRFPRFVVLSSIVLDTWLIGTLIGYSNFLKGTFARIVTFTLITTVLCFLSVTTIFTIHRSPINIYSNSQVSSMELKGASWWFEKAKGGEKIELRANKVNPRRFKDAIYGHFSTRNPFPFTKEVIPDEFGYNENETIADSLGISHNDDKRSTVYMIFSKLDKDYYKKYFKDLWDKATTYSDAHVRKLNEDQTANKLYSNGEVTIWLIAR